MGKNTSTYGTPGLEDMDPQGDRLANEQADRIRQQRSWEYHHQTQAPADQFQGRLNKVKDFFRGSKLSGESDLSPNSEPARDYGPPRADGQGLVKGKVLDAEVASGGSASSAGRPANGGFTAQPAPRMEDAGVGDKDQAAPPAGGSTKRTVKTQGSAGKPSGGEMLNAMSSPAAAETHALGEAGSLPEKEQAFYDRAKKLIGARETGLNLKPIASLIDTWYGGNLAEGYEKPLSEEEKQDKLLALDKGEAERGTTLAERYAEMKAKRDAAMAKAMNTSKQSKLEQQLFLQKVKNAQGKGGKESKHVLFDDPYIEDLVKVQKANPKGFDKMLGKNKTDVMGYGAYVKMLADEAQKINPKMSRSEAVMGAGSHVSKYGMPTKEKKAKAPNEGLFSFGWFDGEDDDDQDDEE